MSRFHKACLLPPPQRAHSDKKRAWQDILTRHGIHSSTLSLNCTGLKNIPAARQLSQLTPIKTVTAHD